MGRASSILQEAVLQQALHVVLGVHALLWDGEYAHEAVVYRHHRLPALLGVAQRVVHDHCLFELGRAGFYAGRHDGGVELAKRDLEDFGSGDGLRHGGKESQAGSAASAQAFIFAKFNIRWPWHYSSLFCNAIAPDLYRLVPVHGPVHASWLNQIEIYFSIVQRKALTPNDFPCLEAVAERLANFERYFESIAHPFEWRFTRTDLNALVARMRDRYAQSQNMKLAA